MVGATGSDISRIKGIRIQEINAAGSGLRNFMIMHGNIFRILNMVNGIAT